MCEAPRQPTILIVEDRSLMRMVLGDFLRTAYPGCAIHEAEDGAQALAQCAALKPDVVLMDISLPDANGIELTARLKAAKREIKVIVVSYLNSPVYIERALAAGALAYVGKDNLLTELIPAVTGALAIAPAGGWSQP